MASVAPKHNALLAALAAVVTMLTVRSMMLTIVAGMAVYTALRLL